MLPSFVSSDEQQYAYARLIALRFSYLADRITGMSGVPQAPFFYLADPST
jgi:hypothetical protein